jgi:hypothetical protein
LSNATGDERLRAAYGEALAGGRVVVGGAHPTPDELEGLVERRMPEAIRLALLDHVMACAACVREVELLRAVERGGVTLARARPVRGNPRLLALAASVLVVVGGGLLARRVLAPSAREPEVVRGDSGGVTLVAPSGPVPAGVSVVLRWRPVTGAVRYEVEVLSERDEVVAGGSTVDTLYTLPGVVRLTPGSRYQWWVRARLRDGTVDRSGLGGFTVAPR